MNLLLEPQAVAEIDSDCVASGISSFGLMMAAGHAVAAAALRRYPQAVRFVVLCGPGNNGGDGYVAARLLAESGAVVALHNLKDSEPATADARRAKAAYAVASKPVLQYQPQIGDVIIDALFGAGLGRDLSEDLVAVIERIKENNLAVLAVDMPSGVCGHSGQVRGGAFAADSTVTFAAAKPGQLLLPGRILCGELEIVDIGIPQRILEAHQAQVQINRPALWQSERKPRAIGGHKFSHGSLVVFSGGASQTGAARLSAMSGLRAGAGLVTIASPPEALSANEAHLTAVMLKDVGDRAALDALLADQRLNAFVLGPGFGIGERARDFVEALAGRRLVLDADGLTSFKDCPNDLFRLFADGETRLILPPHEGEFARLFADIASDDALSKVDKALAAASRAHAVIIYKGADTVIAAPDGRSAINVNAPPWLATAGSGDVLAGICGGLLAQGFGAFQAACAAVHIHGEAGSSAGRGLTAETLINFIDV
jgi:hydroxyethylthiazole kinase-like uncharacterized protein yjeF